MPSQRSKYPEDGLNLIFFSIPQAVLLQLSTGPVLAGLLVGKAAAETLKTIGQASEEIFRGDRLPVLKFPTETKSDSI